MNRTRDVLTEEELTRRLRMDAANWRIVPPDDLRRRTMRTIARHREGVAAPMPDSMRRAAALLAACLLLAATSLLAIRLEAPSAGGRINIAALEDLREAAADRAQVQVERARDLAEQSSLQRELLALATDVESLTESVYRRVAWLDMREN